MLKQRKVVPPICLLISLVMVMFLQVFWPVYQMVEPPFAYAGLILVMAGMGISAFSANMFRKAKTGIEPFSEATTLVTGGFYRYSRNPMYIGMLMMLFGVAFLMGGLGALLPVPLFGLVLRNFFVLGEERFLEAGFGQQYLEYKSQVRRWI